MIIKLGPCNSLIKANLWLHLASWNFPNFLLCLESKTEPSVAKAQNYRGGDTAHTFLMSGTNGVGTPHNFERKHILGGGDTAHTLFMGGTIWEGTLHNIERIKVGTWLAGWLAGWSSQ